MVFVCVVQNPVVYAYIFLFSLTGYLGLNVVLNLVKIYGALIAVTGMAYSALCSNFPDGMLYACYGCMNYYNYNHFTALWILSGTTKMNRYQKKHSPTQPPIMVINHPLSAFSVYYDPWHPPCSIYVPDSLFAESPSLL